MSVLKNISKFVLFFAWVGQNAVHAQGLYRPLLNRAYQAYRTGPPTEPTRTGPLNRAPNPGPQRPTVRRNPSQTPFVPNLPHLNQENNLRRPTFRENINNRGKLQKKIQNSKKIQTKMQN